MFQSGAKSRVAWRCRAAATRETSPGSWPRTSETSAKWIGSMPFLLPWKVRRPPYADWAPQLSLSEAAKTRQLDEDHTGPRPEPRSGKQLSRRHALTHRQKPFHRGVGEPLVRSPRPL